MKTTCSRHRGFSLIELIGVLAIIGILAAIIVPKVIRATARSRVTSTVAGYNTLKTAVAEYFGKNGSFPLRSGTGANNDATGNGRFDADLLKDGYLDQLFIAPIGSQLNDTSKLTKRTHLRSQTADNKAKISINASNGGNNFDLDGDSATADFTAGGTVVSLVIPDVAVSDAVELNELIDKTVVDGSAADVNGRCIFSAPSKGTTTVYLYLGHH